jgi:hypothetical protein
MSTNYYYNKVSNKTYHFTRTDSGKFFEITGCNPFISRSIDVNNDLFLNAKQVSAQYVAVPKNSQSCIKYQVGQ